MIYKISLFVLMLSCSTMSGQEFLTELYFENSNGIKDTVYVGYDPTATTEIDSQFGEIDITSDSLSGLGVRLSRTNVFDYDYDYEYWNEEDFPNIMTYQSKVDILARECSDIFIYWEPPASTILIPIDQLPLKISWDNTAFQNECVEYSFLTVWPHDQWWHVPRFTEYHLPFETSLLMSDNSSLMIDQPSGHSYVNEFNDTLMMLFVNINVEPTLFVSSEEPEMLDVNVFPNPGNEVIYVSSGNDVASYSIYYVDGALVGQGDYTSKGIIISGLDSGTYIIVVKNKNGDTGSVLFEKR